MKDLIVEITGLKKNDHILRLMYSSFDAIRGFISEDRLGNRQPESQETESAPELAKNIGGAPVESRQILGLSYHINIVLPETENVSVFNAIFHSLRENLLR